LFIAVVPPDPVLGFAAKIGINCSGSLIERNQINCNRFAAYGRIKCILRLYRQLKPDDTSVELGLAIDLLLRMPDETERASLKSTDHRLTLLERH
jgi:hypothetical protein